MKKYYVNMNAQANGDHEVHEQACSWLGAVVNRKPLGEFSNCQDAVRAAKKTYPKSNGCIYCCRECHTS